MSLVELKLDATTSVADPSISCLNLRFNGITLKSDRSKKSQDHFRAVVTVHMDV
jgi:hypothetical protein